MRKLFMGVAALLIMASCTQNVQKGSNVEGIVETHVLHAKDVDPKTPQEVIEILKEGNRHFVEKQMVNRDAMAQLVE
ncbi:MAG: hypothetical protein RR346_05425, partial [Bacteroidales bacterium]